MTSNRRKRAILDLKRAEREKKRHSREHNQLLDALPNEVLVNLSLLNKSSGFGGFSTPEFVKRGYYIDQAFKCRDCGVEEIWTATQQKWWYEANKASLYTGATRCRLCRRRHRLHREKSLAGAQRKVSKKISKI